MRLVKISGGKYEINRSEGRAIASFVPPPLLKNLEWESLSTQAIWLFEEFSAYWEIIAHWLVYYRTRAVDIHQMPFTHQEFLDKRPIAELYNSQLDLCAEVWEATEIRELYPTPYHWWCACIIEVQEVQKKSILSGGGFGIVTHTKGQCEDGLRELRQKLEAEVIPFLETSENQHLCRLYKASIKLKNSAKVKQLWVRYLKQLLLCARAIKSNPGTKSIVHLKNGLYYREGNTLIPIRIPESIGSRKDAVLNVRARFALLPE